MSDFVAYHHPERMDYPVTKISTLDVFTDKDVVPLIGQRVWVVGREGKDYYIGSVFRADRSIAGACGFKAGAEGQHGHVFGKLANVNGLPWFNDLKRITGNFAFGLTEISDLLVSQGLAAAAHSAGCVTLP